MKLRYLINVLLALYLIATLVSSCGTDNDEWFDLENPEFWEMINQEDGADVGVFENGVYETEDGTIRLIIYEYNIILQKLSAGKVISETHYTYYVENGRLYLILDHAVVVSKAYEDGQDVNVLNFGKFHKVS